MFESERERETWLDVYARLHGITCPYRNIAQTVQSVIVITERLTYQHLFDVLMERPSEREKVQWMNRKHANPT